MALDFKRYRRTQIAEMADWEPGFDMSAVSISDVDLRAGSPKVGDKIARNPANHDDQWLVAGGLLRGEFRTAGGGDHMLRASIIGNLGGDPELRYSQKGEQIVTVSVAVNQRKRLPGSEEWKESTEWFRVRRGRKRREPGHLAAVSSRRGR